MKKPSVVKKKLSRNAVRKKKTFKYLFSVLADPDASANRKDRIGLALLKVLTKPTKEQRRKQDKINRANDREAREARPPEGKKAQRKEEAKESAKGTKWGDVFADRGNLQ